MSRIKRGQAGFVYFVEAPEINRIKIGYTANDPEDGRFWNLRNGSPVPLRLIGSIPGTIETERSLHARFSAMRVYGEWFLNERLLLDFIDRLPGLIRPKSDDAINAVSRKAPLSLEARNTRKLLAKDLPRAAKAKRSGQPWSDDPAILSRQIAETDAVWRQLLDR